MAIGPYDRDGARERGEPSLRRDDGKRDAAGKLNSMGGDTLRATPFTDEVFAERDGPPRTGGASVSLIVGVVLGVVLVGGVGWYAFQGPGGVSLAPGEVQTIKAEATPYKMKPDNPGGMTVENQDKLVYDRVAKGAAPNRVENLLPPPEEPKAPPKAPEVKPEPAKAAAPAPAPEKTAEKAPEKAPEKVAEKTMESIVKAANEDSSRAVAPVAPAPSSDAAALAAAVAAATTAKPSVVEAPKTPEAKTEVHAITPAAPLPAGSFQIQLVSVPTEDAAQSEWKRISGRHKDLLATLTPAVTKADLGEKGIYYRLRAGPLADKAAADALCATLAADKVSCIVIKP